MNTTPAKTVNFHGFYGEISGVRVLIATHDGEAEAVEVDSIKEALGAAPSDPLWHHFDREHFAGVVAIDGLSRTTYLVSLEAFFKFCMLNPSPQLNAFRDELARVARSVQQRGSYIDPNAGPNGFIPAGFEQDPEMQIIARIAHQRMETLKLKEGLAEAKGEIADVRGQIADVRQQIGRGPSGWTVAAWLEHHKVDATLDVAKAEGKRLRDVCVRHGILIPPDDEKVCNGSSFGARIWPRKAIDIWWPDFCWRYGREVFWRV